MPKNESTVFPLGHFLGDCAVRLTVPGFVVADRRATIPEGEVETHSHAEAHFVLVPRGRYLSTAFGATAPDAAPVLIYNPPGTTHRDRLCVSGDRFVTISITAAALRATRNAVALPDHAVALARPAVAVALRIARAIRARGPACGLDTESLCMELLAATSAASDLAVTRAPAWLRRIRARIHDACGDDLSLADLARQAGVHPVHAARAFRRHFRCTPGAYLRRCRLDKAAALLAAGGRPIGEVALDCGYCDQAHLSRAFKAAFGRSPRHYRQVGRIQDPYRGCA